MNGVEGTIFTLMAAYVVFIDTAGLVLVVAGVGWGRPGGHKQEGQGKKKRRQRGRLPQAGRGRGEPGAWGRGKAGAIL